MLEARRVSFVPYGENNPGWASLWGLSFPGARIYKDEPRVNYIYLLAKGKAPDKGELHRRWREHLGNSLVEAYNFKAFVPWFASRTSIPDDDIPGILESLEKVKNADLPVIKLAEGGPSRLREDFALDIADFLIPRVGAITKLCKHPEFRTPLGNINALSGIRR